VRIFLVQSFLVAVALAWYIGYRLIKHRSRKYMAHRLSGISIRTEDFSGAFIDSRKEARQSLLGRAALAIPGIEKVEGLLARSGSELTIVAFSARVLQIGLGLALTVGLISQSLVVGVFAGGLGAAIVLLHLKIRCDKRRSEFDAQLPEALDFIGRALRAGHGLMMAIGMVGDELPAPIGHEFKKIFDEVNFGVSVDDALSNASRRIESADLNFFIISTKIYRETGGNFNEIIGSLSNTIRKRSELQGKVRVLSSEGRYSGVLLGVLPFMVGGAMTFMNQEYMSVLWFSEQGQNLVGIGLVLIIAGFAWMWSIAKIKV